MYSTLLIYIYIFICCIYIFIYIYIYVLIEKTALKLKPSNIIYIWFSFLGYTLLLSFKLHHICTYPLIIISNLYNRLRLNLNSFFPVSSTHSSAITRSIQKKPIAISKTKCCFLNPYLFSISDVWTIKRF